MLFHSCKFQSSLLFLLEAAILEMFITLSAGATLALTFEKPPLVFGQGEQRLLRIQGLKKYARGSNVIHILPLKDSPHASHSNSLLASESLLIKGVSPGLGDLWVWKQDGSSEHRSIRVQTKMTGGLNPALEKALGGLNEVEVLYTGRGVILKGTIQSQTECSLVKGLAKNY
ncbi:MAG: hypothetical protein ABIQ95_09415, partial [Bdellovibrionia bacterium]